MRKTMNRYIGPFPPKPMSSETIMELQGLLAGGDIDDVNLGDDEYLYIYQKLRFSDARQFEGIEKESDAVPAHRQVTYHQQGGLLVRITKHTDVWYVADTWQEGRWSSIHIVRREIDRRISDPTAPAVDAMYEAALEAGLGHGHKSPACDT